MHCSLKFISEIGLYMFRTVPLSIIRSLAIYTQKYIQFMLLASSQHNLYDIYHCYVYSTRLLMMDRDTV